MSRQFYTWGRPAKIRDGDLDWQSFADCQYEPATLFFGPDNERQPERDAREAKAKQICDGCPVCTDCLNYSLRAAEKAGVWGGLNADERHSLRRRLMRSAAPRQPRPKDPAPKPRPPRTDVTGTRRRLQALAVVGHGTVTISARLGGIAAPSHLNDLRLRERGSVRVEVAEALARVFPRLVVEPPAVNSFGVARLAAERGWDGPDAWSGVDMDDPEAQPHQTANAA